MKAGQPDYAVQTWRLGLAKFPLIQPFREELLTHDRGIETDGALLLNEHPAFPARSQFEL